MQSQCEVVDLVDLRSMSFLYELQGWWWTPQAPPCFGGGWSGFGCTHAQTLWDWERGKALGQLPTSYSWFLSSHQLHYRHIPGGWTNSGPSTDCEDDNRVFLMMEEEDYLFTAWWCLQIASLAPKQKKFLELKSQLELKTYDLSLFKDRAEQSEHHKVGIILSVHATTTMFVNLVFPLFILLTCYALDILVNRQLWQTLKYTIGLDFS